MIRYSTEHQRRALKTAFGVLVEVLGGPSAAEKVTRIGEPAISRARNHDQNGYFPAIDAVLDLELAAGSRIITDILAQAHGCRLVPIEPAAVSIDGLRAGGVEMVETAAAAFREIVTAIEDGRVSEAERRRVEPLLHALKSLADAALDGVGAKSEDN